MDRKDWMSTRNWLDRKDGADRRGINQDENRNIGRNKDRREFLRCSILSVLGTVGVSCYILADTFFVAKGLGSNGLAALNLAIPVYNFIHGSGLMIGMGSGIAFSIAKSQHNKRLADRIYVHSLGLAFTFSALFLVIGLFFSDQLAKLLGADTGLFEMTRTYLFWLLFFAPAFILNDIFLCFVRNDGSEQLAMIGMLVGSLANVFLDYLFIFPLNMGIFGAILATGLSPLISMLCLSKHWLTKKNSFHLVTTRMELHLIGQSLSLGFPSLIAQISSGVVMILFNALILRLSGNIAVAAYGIIANLALVLNAVDTGIIQGAQPLISRAYGTGNRRQARVYLRYSMIFMLCVSIASYLFLFAFSGPVVSVFNSEHNRMLEQTATLGLKLYFLAAPFIGYNVIQTTYLSAVNRSWQAHVLSLARGLVVVVPAAFIMAYLFGLNGIWLTCLVSEFFVAIAGIAMDFFLQRKVMNYEN